MENNVSSASATGQVINIDLMNVNSPAGIVSVKTSLLVQIANGSLVPGTGNRGGEGNATEAMKAIGYSLRNTDGTPNYGEAKVMLQFQNKIVLRKASKLEVQARPELEGKEIPRGYFTVSQLIASNQQVMQHKPILVKLTQQVIQNLQPSMSYQGVLVYAEGIRNPFAMFINV